MRIANALRHPAFALLLPSALAICISLMGPAALAELGAPAGPLRAANMDILKAWGLASLIPLSWSTMAGARGGEPIGKGGARAQLLGAAGAIAWLIPLADGGATAAQALARLFA